MVFLTLRAPSRNHRMSSIGSNIEAIACWARSCAVRRAQVADVEMAARMGSNRVPGLWIKHLAIMIQETKTPPVADWHVNNLQKSDGDDEFEDNSNKMYLNWLGIQRMIHSSMLSYSENTLRRLTYVTVQNIMEIPLNSTGKEPT